MQSADKVININMKLLHEADSKTENLLKLNKIISSAENFYRVVFSSDMHYLKIK